MAQKMKEGRDHVTRYSRSVGAACRFAGGLSYRQIWGIVARVTATAAIIQYLGYEPWPVPSSLPDKLISERRRRGLSVKRAARQMGVDEGTWTRWERGDRIPNMVPHSGVGKFLTQ